MNKVKFFCSDAYTYEYMARVNIEHQINEFAETYEILNVSMNFFEQHHGCNYYTAAVVYKENENEASI